MPAFIQALRVCRSAPIVKLALEFAVLTATRSGEARGAARSEIEGPLWTIPPARMKARTPHVVPLAARRLEIAVQARALNPTSELLFPGPRTGKVLSDMTLTKLLRDNGYADRATAHGFRSSFRNWCTEIDKCREVVAEAALAHTVRDKTEAAESDYSTGADQSAGAPAPLARALPWTTAVFRARCGLPMLTVLIPPVVDLTLAGVAQRVEHA